MVPDPEKPSTILGGNKAVLVATLVVISTLTFTLVFPFMPLVFDFGELHHDSDKWKPNLGVALRADLTLGAAGRWSRSREGWRQYDYGEEVLKSIDTAVEPCEDFYRFVCGRWNNSHPGHENEFTRLYTDLVAAAIQKLALSRQRDMRQLTVVEYAGEALRYCLMTYVLKLDDLTPFHTVLQEYPFTWPRIELGVRFDILDLAVSLALKWGVPVLFDMEVTTDLRTDNNMVLRLARSDPLQDWIGQWFQKGGPNMWAMTLPRTFDPNVDHAFITERVLEACVQALMLLITGKTQDVSKPAYVTIGDVESITRLRMTSERWMATINRHLPEGVQVRYDSEMHLLDENFLENIAEFVNYFESSNKEDSVAILVGWVLSYHMAPALTYRIFKDYKNTQSMAVHYCLQLVSEIAVYPLNWFLTEQSVSQEDWNTTRVLLGDVHDAMAQYFDWMDPDTRQRALSRLRVIRHVIAYPTVDSTREQLETRYSYLRETVKPPFGVAYIRTKLKLRESRNLLLKTSVARQDDDWFRVPLVNAMFLPYYHIVYIPTSLMMPPFLTSQFPAASFGGLGHVLAHEESHAFDAEGAPADPDGLYRHWYSPPTKSHLEDRKQCLRAVYDVPSGGSWPTESEDYADSQGLMVAETAFKRRLSLRAPSGLGSFTNEQLFYVSSCFKWCNSMAVPPPAVKGNDSRRTNSAVHSDMYKRCNSPLLLNQGFSAAFNCTPYAAMSRRQKCAFP
ncbi:neprilysin-2-like [Haemaphysalis longicornis]